MHSILFVDGDNTRITPKFINLVSSKSLEARVFGNQHISNRWRNLHLPTSFTVTITESRIKNSTDLLIISEISKWLSNYPNGTVYLMTHDIDYAIGIEALKPIFRNTRFIGLGELKRTSKHLINHFHKYIDIT